MSQTESRPCKPDLTMGNALGFLNLCFMGDRFISCREHPRGIHPVGQLYRIVMILMMLVVGKVIGGPCRSLQENLLAGGMGETPALISVLALGVMGGILILALVSLLTMRLWSWAPNDPHDNEE